MPLAANGGWSAQLHLKVAAGPTGSIPSIRFHNGPLRLQKMLYPEGPGVMHAIVVHPPGGVVGGDRLDTTIEIDPNAHCLVTTPGAAKWYRSEARMSEQKTQLTVANNASLEWLPQENIVFNGAISNWQTTVTIGSNTSVIGMEVIMLGRKARGEQFTAGSLSNRFNVFRSTDNPESNGSQINTLVFSEQWTLTGQDARLNTLQGLSGLPCFGQLWAVGSTSSLQAARQAIHNYSAQENDSEPNRLISDSYPVAYSVTLIRDQILLIRAQGAGPEMVRGLLEKVWQLIRFPIVGRVCVPPRIWST